MLKRIAGVLSVLALAFVFLLFSDDNRTVCPPVWFETPAAILMRTSSVAAGLVRQQDGSYTRYDYNPFGAFPLLSKILGYDTALSPCEVPPDQGQTPATPPSHAGAPGYDVQFLGKTTAGNPLVALRGYSFNSATVFVGNSDYTVHSSTSYPLGDDPFTLLGGDFNGDGNPDFAVTVYANAAGASNRIAMFAGDSNGAFQPLPDITLAGYPISLAAGDFDRDNKLDMVVLSYSQSDNTDTVMLYKGKGDGTFQTPTDLATVSGLNIIGAFDVNGDGKLDLVTTRNGGTGKGEVQVYLGNGDGTFQSARVSPTGLAGSYVAAGDLNQDGKTDLAIAVGNANAVGVALGNGDGTFAQPLFYATNYKPNSLVITDLNRDGHLDVLLAAGDADHLMPLYGSASVMAFLGNGDGTLRGARFYDVAQATSGVAIGDWDGDGKPDFASSGGADLYLWKNQGDGAFAQSAAINIPAGQLGEIATADFNQDGKPDLAIASQSSSAGVQLLLGKGDGTFQAPVSLPAGLRVLQVKAADFNQDGKPDLVAANAGAYGGSPPGDIEVLLNSGNGAFQAAKTFTAGTSPTSIAVGDWNGDGKQDIAVADTYSTNMPQAKLMLYLGNGDGTFQEKPAPQVSIAPVSMATADINGDQISDLILAGQGQNYSFGVETLQGNGDGSFKDPVKYPTDFGPSALIARDMNGDGAVDLVIGHCCGDVITTVMSGLGDGSFAPEFQCPSASTRGCLRREI